MAFVIIVIIHHRGVSIWDNSKQEEISHLLPASLVYSKSVLCS